MLVLALNSRISGLFLPFQTVSFTTWVYGLGSISFVVLQMYLNFYVTSPNIIFIPILEHCLISILNTASATCLVIV